MRSYGEFCAMAKALDVVGDRWTLLIVRELLLRGACRYTDLRDGLPGIATNLLADRLRQLEDAGVVSREEAPPPIATTLFRLTPRGEELRPVLQELTRWGLPYMIDEPKGQEFRLHWLRAPAELYLRDHAPQQPPVTIELRTGDAPLLIEARDGEVHAHPGKADHADAVVSGTPYLVAAVLTGVVALDDGVERGLHVDGDERALRRVLPREPAVSLDSRGVD